MHCDACDFLAKEISTGHRSTINNKTTEAIACGTMGECGAIKAGTDYEEIVFCRHRIDIYRKDNAFLISN